MHVHKCAQALYMCTCLVFKWARGWKNPWKEKSSPKWQKGSRAESPFPLGKLTPQSSPFPRPSDSGGLGEGRTAHIWASVFSVFCVITMHFEKNLCFEDAKSSVWMLLRLMHPAAFPVRGTKVPPPGRSGQHHPYAHTQLPPTTFQRGMTHLARSPCNDAGEGYSHQGRNSGHQLNTPEQATSGPECHLLGAWARGPWSYMLSHCPGPPGFLSGTSVASIRKWAGCRRSHSLFFEAAQCGRFFPMALWGNNTLFLFLPTN